jgi:hypothetical protein
VVLVEKERWPTISFLQELWISTAWFFMYEVVILLLGVLQVLHQVWSSAEDNGVPQPALPAARHLPQVCPSVSSLLSLLSLICCTPDFCLKSLINFWIWMKFIHTDSIAIIRFLRDFAYDNVANNRYTVFGRSETEACEILWIAAPKTLIPSYLLYMIRYQ